MTNIKIKNKQNHFVFKYYSNIILRKSPGNCVIYYYSFYLELLKMILYTYREPLEKCSSSSIPVFN